MLAVHLLDPRPGQRVLDGCAAPGGKTGHLWEWMKGQGQLVALEANPARRGELRQTLARLYPSNPGLLTPDWDTLKTAAEQDPFDRVLIDAPCQGLGLLRRHPEIRWDGRLRFQRQMQTRQRQILEEGARCVKPGGALLWVTCSPTTAENEEIVLPWLQAHEDWRLLNPELPLPRDWLSWLQNNHGVLRTRPDSIPCDGFAMILLQRQ
jgi:16S rRNA (cytosine967-C5)-methyltransferase